MPEVNRNGTTRLQLALAWTFVGIPLAWGIWITLQKAVVLFH